MNLQTAKSVLFFENFIVGTWNYSVPFIMISTWKHFKALNFKIMFLENSKHMDVWNISWTHFPPRKFLWKKIAFVSRTRTFCTIVMLWGMSTITFPFSCESCMCCDLLSSQYCWIPECMDIKLCQFILFL